jgi:type IV secretion system protein VirB3
MDHVDKPREVVFYQSANRPNLLLGADRELVLVAVMVAVGLAFSLASWWGVGVAVALWLGSIGVLQRMASADPLLRRVYLRHIRYLGFYRAKSGLYARSAETPPRWR